MTFFLLLSFFFTHCEASPAVSLYTCTWCNLASDRSEFFLVGGKRTRCLLQAIWTPGLLCSADSVTLACIMEAAGSSSTRSFNWNFCHRPMIQARCGNTFGAGWTASRSVHWASFHLVSLRPSLPTSYITGTSVSQRNVSMDNESCCFPSRKSLKTGFWVSLLPGTDLRCVCRSHFEHIHLSLLCWNVYI